jgi:cell division protein FtsQ
MKTEIDPRLADRRKLVAEGHARSRLGRLLLALGVAAMIGAGVWMLNSPWFSVQHLRVLGVERSRVVEVLDEYQLVAGKPLIAISSARVEEALRADPWVGRVEVRVEWPQTVVVEVVERVPVAWSRLESGWGLRAVDGTLLAQSDAPTDGYPLVEAGALEASVATPSLLGSLAFVAELPPQIAPEATVEEREGELWATVAGFSVRLGPPTEMEAKARAMTAILATQPEPGSIITLIAPSRPAVLPPGAAESIPPVEDEA